MLNNFPIGIVHVSDHINRLMEKLEAQAVAKSELCRVNLAVMNVIEQVVTNGRGYFITCDAHDGNSTSYAGLGRSLRMMDVKAGREAPTSFYWVNPIQDMRHQLDYLRDDIETYGLQWVYEMVNSPETVQDPKRAQKTIRRMTELKMDMDQYKMPSVCGKMAFANQDFVDFAWSVREFVIDKARDTALEMTKGTETELNRIIRHSNIPED